MFLFLGRDGWADGYLMLPPHEGKIRRCFGGSGAGVLPCPIESAPAHFAGWAPLTMQSTDFYSKSRKGTARGLNAGEKIPCRRAAKRPPCSTAPDLCRVASSHIQRRTADAAPDGRRGSAATIRSPRLGSGTCDLLCSAPQLLGLFFSLDDPFTSDR